MPAAVTTYDLKSLPLATTGVGASTVVFGSTSGQPKPVPDPIIMTALTGYLDTLYGGVINARSYGATGDGVTDDTAALQAAIDDCSFQGGNETKPALYLPAGTYKISAPLVPPNYSLHMFGDGAQQTIIDFGTAAACIRTAAIPYSNPNFHDFGVTGTVGYGFDFSPTTSEVYNGQMERIYIQCGSDGIYAPRLFSFEFNSINVNSTGGHCFRVMCGPSVSFRNCYAASAGTNKAGYRLGGCIRLYSCNGVNDAQYWGVFGSNPDSGTAFASDFSGSDYPDIELHGCNVEEFKVCGIQIERAARNFYMHGGVLNRAALNTDFHSYFRAIESSAINAMHTFDCVTVFTGGGDPAAPTGALFYTDGSGFALDRGGGLAAGGITKQYVVGAEIEYTIPVSGQLVGQQYSQVAERHSALYVDQLTAGLLRFNEYALTTSGTVTPDVTGYDIVRVQNSGACTINGFTFTEGYLSGSVPGTRNGRLIVKIEGTTSPTLKHNTAAKGGLRLLAGVDIKPAKGDVLEFVHSYYYDGTHEGWIQVGPGEIGDVPVNVRMFGAKGDGTTDDTVAIQAAITACASAGRALHIPAGTYKITASLTIGAKIKIYGDGNQASILSLSTASTATFAIVINLGDNTSVIGLDLGGFGITGNAGAASGCGIYMNTSATNSAISQSIVHDIYIKNVTTGMSLDGTLYMSAFRNITVTTVGQYGWYCPNSRGEVIYNNFTTLEVTGVASSGYAYYLVVAGSQLNNLTADACCLFSGAYTSVQGLTVEGMFAATPASTYVIQYNSLASLRDVAIVNVPNSKCVYGIDALGSNPIHISNVRFPDSGAGNQPNRAINLHASGTGIVENIHFDRTITNLIEAYLSASILSGFTFLQCSHITATYSQANIYSIATGTQLRSLSGTVLATLLDGGNLCIGANATPTNKLEVEGNGYFGGTLTATSHMQIGAAAEYYWTGRSTMLSPADGVILLQNNANTDFSRLQFGGTSASFPSLKRSSAQLHARLADDSAFAVLQVGDLYANNSLICNSTLYFGVAFDRSTIISPADGQIALRNAAGTDFTSLQFGGTTASFPSLKRSGTGLEVRLADDSGYSGLTASLLHIGSAGGEFQINSRFILTAPSDGVVTFENAAGTDFGRLQFGGTTSSFPSLKRSGAGLQVRLADDSTYAALTALTMSIDPSGALLWLGRSFITSESDGTLLMRNNAANDFSRLQFGGTTSSFPALRRTGTALDVVLADASTWADLRIGALTLSQTPAAVGTGVKTINAVADSSTNFGHYIVVSFGGTPYYIPCSSVAPT